jgi:hypothetical protein
MFFAVVLRFVLGGLLLAGPTGTPAASTATFAYEAPAVARVDIDDCCASHAMPDQLSDRWEGSAPPPDDARGTSTTSSALRNATKAVDDIPAPGQGQTVYRVYGGDSAPGGASWSPTNPGSVPNYRNAAGLPSGGASGANNTGRFVVEGVLEDPSKVVLTRRALPLDGMSGGLPEYIVPGWMDNGAITITRVSGVNPHF